MNMHRHGPCPFQMHNWFWCLLQACSEPSGIGHCHGHSKKRNWFWYLIDWQRTLQNKHLCDHSGGGTSLGVSFWCLFGLEKWWSPSFAFDFASSTCDADQQWKTLVTLGIMSFLADGITPCPTGLNVFLGRNGFFFQSILTGFQRLANVDVMKPQKWSDLLYLIGPSAVSCCVGVHILTIMRSEIGFTAEYGGSKFIK